MVSDLFFHQLVLVALVWLCLMLHWAWPSDPAACPTTPEPPTPLPKRKREPTPFAGLTHKPYCDACEHAIDSRPQAPSAPPPRIVPTRGRRCQVDAATHCLAAEIEREFIALRTVKPSPNEGLQASRWGGLRVAKPSR